MCKASLQKVVRWNLEWSCWIHCRAFLRVFVGVSALVFLHSSDRHELGSSRNQQSGSWVTTVDLVDRCKGEKTSELTTLVSICTFGESASQKVQRAWAAHTLSNAKQIESSVSSMQPLRPPLHYKAEETQLKNLPLSEINLIFWNPSDCNSRAFILCASAWAKKTSAACSYFPSVINWLVEAMLVLPTVTVCKTSNQSSTDRWINLTNKVSFKCRVKRIL